MKLPELPSMKFQHLPGNPPPHKVVGELKDGTKVRANVVEMVWNDWLFINAVQGEGAYESSYRDEPDAPNMQALEIAKRLYAQ